MTFSVIFIVGYIVTLGWATGATLLRRWCCPAIA